MTLGRETVKNLAYLCERNGKLDLDIFAYQVELIVKREVGELFMHISEPPRYLNSIGGLTNEYQLKLQRMKEDYGASNKHENKINTYSDRFGE